MVQGTLRRRQVISAPSQLDERLASQVDFVLVEPQHPGNVGAVARAMSNTGLGGLTIVAPPAFDPQQAKWMAPGCDALLGRVRIVASVDDALRGVHHVYASTARHRRHRQPVYAPSEFAQVAVSQLGAARIAVLFGREDFGLSKTAVHRAQAIVRIPTMAHASLNLGQAAMIIAYALFERARALGMSAQGRMLGGRNTVATARLAGGDARDARVDAAGVEPVVQSLVELLDRVGYTRVTNPEKVALTARVALLNARMTHRQVDALRGMIKQIDYALDHAGDE